MKLRLLVERSELEGYERKLVDGLFFDERTETDVIALRSHYHNTRFRPEKLIEEEIHLDAIFSESDSMLSGVRSALRRYGMEPRDIITIGCDYTAEAREAIRHGTQTASILFPLGGRKSVETALNILKGEKVPKHISIPVKLVTRDNVDEVAPVF